eukprot:scaffold125292_cov26-Tisochrysis_lutea.AAC.1
MMMRYRPCAVPLVTPAAVTTQIARARPPRAPDEFAGRQRSRQYRPCWKGKHVCQGCKQHFQFWHGRKCHTGKHCKVQSHTWGREYRAHVSEEGVFVLRQAHTCHALAGMPKCTPGTELGVKKRLPTLLLESRMASF